MSFPGRAELWLQATALRLAGDGSVRNCGPVVRGGYPVPQKLNRVGLLAPMTHELMPLVEMLGLVARADDPYALLDATNRVLDDGGIDHVIVTGIAGGLDPALGIGAIVVPATVLHGDAGTTHVPAPLGAHEARATIRSSDDFLTDPAAHAELSASGVVGLDMETAAVAVVCEARGVPWSVFRSISDRPADGLVDGEVWEMTQIDGSADDALNRYLESNPDAAPRLAQMAGDMEIATYAAAAAAIRACGVEPRSA